MDSGSPPTSPFQLLSGAQRTEEEVCATAPASGHSTPRFWRITDRGGSPPPIGGGGGGSPTRQPLWAAEIEPLGHPLPRPLSRQSSLTEALHVTAAQQAGQQQLPSPRLAVKTPRASGRSRRAAAGGRPQARSRSALALCFLTAAPAGRVQEAAAAAARSNVLSALAALDRGGTGGGSLTPRSLMMHHSSSLDIPK